MLALKKFKAAMGIAALLVGASGSGVAQADVVTTWGYNITSIFSEATYTDAGCPIAGLCSAAGGTQLIWGDPVNAGEQSSLTIGNTPAIGNVDTFLGGGSPPAVAPYLGFSNTLTHQNNPIYPPSLLSAVLRATVVLTPTNPAGPAQPNQVMNFDIAFEETTNDPNGDCVAESPPGNPCNDIFVLTGGLLNTDFDYDGQTYFVNIFPIAGGVLNILPAEVCDAVDQAPGCIGFTTIEGQSNTLAFGFTISTERLEIPVPEPGILALLGASLFGMAAVRRRRTH